MPEKSHKNNPKNFAAQKHENVANNDRAGAAGTCGQGGDWGEGSANASAETLITKRKMSKFFCGLRGSLNVRGNKCNFFSVALSFSPYLPLVRSLALFSRNLRQGI